MDILLHAAYLVGGILLTWKGSEILEKSSGGLCAYYRVPDLIRGTLVVAVGSSFPELMTTIISTLVHGEFDLGMSAIVGSAVFNILVIPGLSGLLAKRPVKYDIRVVYRDGQFYLISVAVLVLAFSFALIYHPVPEAQAGSRFVGLITRPIALLPLLLYGLYLFLQHQEFRGAGAIPMPEDAQEPPKSVLGAWLWLPVSLALVVFGVEGLVRTALWLGTTLHTPSFLWGATVIAAATSIPDTLISVHAAKKGEGDVSIGNVLGSNVFDLLIAIPAGILIAGASPVDFGVAAPLMAVLTLATIVLFTTMRTGLQLGRAECTLLLTLYVAFIVWLVLETVGVMGWLGGHPAG